MKRLVMCAILAGSLAACTATGPAFTHASAPPDGSALVYIYRTSATAFGARKAKFYIDSAHVADINMEGYTWIHVPSGIHSLTQRWPKDTMTETIGGKVRFVAGRTYYFKLSAGSSYNELHWQLSPQPAETALRDMQDFRYQQATADAGS